MAAIDSAYQYYLSTYGTSRTSRYDTHKKSQLRAIYNNIVKINKDSPLYKIKYSGDVQKFAIDIKERTRSIQNIVASLSDTEDGIEALFRKSWPSPLMTRLSGQNISAASRMRTTLFILISKSCIWQPPDQPRCLSDG